MAKHSGCVFSVEDTVITGSLVLCGWPDPECQATGFLKI
jgi:hypothetical protein